MVNHTEKEQKVPLELRIYNRLADAYEFTIPAGKSVTRTLQQFSAEGGEVEAAIEVKDAFPLDDHAYAALPKPRPIKVRLVTPGNLFLERALAADYSDDWVKVWVNRELVHASSDAPPCSLDQDRFAVTLQKGPNRILIKVGNFTDAWGFCLRTVEGGNGLTLAKE